MLILLLLAACGSTLSNAVFDEDADFLAALPTSDTLHLSYPVPDTGAATSDDQAALYGLTVSTLQVGGYVLSLATDATEQVLALPPSERGVDYRVWGPTPFDQDPSYFLRIEMTRSSTGATYAYAFQLGQTSAGPWFEFLEGSHDIGEEDVALGSGWIRYQPFGTDAEILINYDLREGSTISAEVSQLDLGDGPIDQQWTWTQASNDDEASTLHYLQPASVLDATDGTSSGSSTAGQELTVDSRWLVDGTGRGDAVITGSELSSTSWELHQCWANSGATTWSWDDIGWLGDQGAQENCALE